MKHPRFSIVIPTYNRRAFIAKAIDSALAQSFGDFEIIVVDDGSSDDTGEIVREIHDPRVRYHYKENEERAVARNTGIAMSNGEYVGFLDSDDEIYPEHLEFASRMIEKYRRPEIFHLGYEVRTDSEASGRKIGSLPETANEVLIQGNVLSCNGVFLRRDIALKYKFNPDRVLSGSEDYELWLRLASRFPIYCDDHVTSAIIQHDARSVLTTDRDRLVRRIELLERCLFEDEAFVKAYQKKIPQFRAYLRIYIALHLALARNDRTGAFKLLGESLYHSPYALRNRAFYATVKRVFW